MKLYLIQHGEAVSEEVDPSRSLTAKGRSDVEKVAEFVKGFNLEIISIRHSTKTRARQTAEILASILSLQDRIIQSEGLAPNDPIEPLQEELKDMEGNLMIVGHLPFLSRIASSLVLNDSSMQIISFKQGGIVCLCRENNWQIEWIITPALL